MCVPRPACVTRRRQPSRNVFAHTTAQKPSRAPAPESTGFQLNNTCRRRSCTLNPHHLPPPQKRTNKGGKTSAKAFVTNPATIAKGDLDRYRIQRSCAQETCDELKHCARSPCLQAKAGISLISVRSGGVPICVQNLHSSYEHKPTPGLHVISETPTRPEMFAS